MKITLRLCVISLSLSFLLINSGIAQPRGLGDLTTDEEFKKIPRVAERATRDLVDLPSSFSLKQYAPPVKDQGKYSTCVGWSGAYAARTISYAIKRNFTNRDSIIKYSFSPGHLYYRIKRKDDLNCQVGSSMYMAVKVLKEGGNLLASENFPDCAPIAGAVDETTKSVPYKIKDYLSLMDYKITKNEVLKIKKSITEKKPVIISQKVYTSFFYLQPDGLWTTKSTDTYNGNHAMCIVGYDDNKAGGAFEVMNSWGTMWGNKGFFWLTYDQLMTYGNAALELMDSDVIENKDVNVEKPKLSGKIEFVKLDGGTMTVTRTKISTRSITVEDDERADYSKYKFDEVYAGGTGFKIKFTTTAPAYVYIFGEDDKQVISKLFPYSSNVSAAINSSNATVYLPSETKHAKLSTTPGKENICVLYSKQQLNFDELLDGIRQERISIAQAIKNRFAKNLLPVNQVQFSDNNIAFQAAADDSKMVAFFVELEHK